MKALKYCSFGIFIIIQLTLSWNILLAADLLRTDPSYLEPFYDETWTFQSAVKTITVTFNTQVTVSSVTGYVSLDAIATEDNTDWRLNYDTDGYDLYHASTEEKVGKEEHFKFQFSGINNTEVSGTYHIFIFKSFFDTTETDPIPMTGKLVADDETANDQPTTALTYDDGYKAGIAQCQMAPSSCGIEVGQIGIIEHLQAFYNFFWEHRGSVVDFPGELAVPYEYATEWQDGNNLGYTVSLKDKNGQLKASFDIIFNPQ